VYRLFEQKPERVLRYVLYLQLVLWTLIPAFTYASAPLDVLENIGWGREWQLGYYKHPPLQAWLSYGAFLLGNGRMWPIYLVSQLCVVATQLGVFALVRDIAGARRGLWAVLLFAVSYYATLPTPEFNANVLQMPLWIWSALALRRALVSGNPLWWFALAATLSLCLYAKYSVVVLLAALVLALVARRDGRKALRSPWPWLAGLAALAACAPQLWWLRSADFLPLTFTADRNATPGLADRAADIGSFLGSQALDLIVSVAVLLIAGARRSPVAPESSDDRRFVLVLALAPYLLTIASSLASTVGLRDMWGAPMAALVVAAVVVLFEPGVSRPRARIAMTLCAAVFLLTPAITGAAVSYGPLRAKPPKIAFPAPAMVESLDEIWSQQTETPLDIVAGRTWPASLVASYSRDRPHVFVDGNWRYNPWITRERVAKRGMLVVWQEDGEPPPQLAALGPFQARGRALVRYKRGGKMAALNWAIRAPGLPAPPGNP
jgi:4-amino-4-deoxy-L-arabinose transferase-like glycosyltransferase